MIRLTIRSLGDDTLGGRVHTRIFNNPTKFEPADPRIARLTDVPPQHSVILYLRNLIVEVEMDYILAHAGHPGRYVPTQPRVFRIEKSNRKVEILIACPDR